MQTLIAYRYQEMLKRYGGVPIVTKTLTVEDNLEIPRATVKQVMEHIERLCDEAVPLAVFSFRSCWFSGVLMVSISSCVLEFLPYLANE